MINPLTKFSVIRDLFNEELKDEKKDTFYVRNVTNEFCTQYHAYKSIIFEMMPEGGEFIASVTLFKV